MGSTKKAPAEGIPDGDASFCDPAARTQVVIENIFMVRCRVRLRQEALTYQKLKPDAEG